MSAMHEWDDAQVGVLDDAAGTVVVMGGPGTGRTTVCLEVAARYVEAGGSLSDVLLLGQTRPAAQALRNGLVRRLGGAHLDPHVMTVHALARRILAAQQGSGRLLTAPEQEFRIRELLAARDMSDWPEELRACAQTSQFASDVRVMAARLRQEGCDPQDLTAAGMRWGVTQWQVLGLFLADYLDVLDLEGAVDYAEAVHRARIALARPGAVNEVRSRVKLLVCDDVTECDPSQIRLIAQLARCHVPCVLTADPDQTVYGFRGASAERLDDLIDEFPDVSVHHLTTNHRNSEHVAGVVESLRTAMPAVPSSRRLRRQANHAASTDSGTVAAIRAGSTTRLVRKVAGSLRHAHVAKGVPWNEMAVVTRHGAELGVIATILASEGIPVVRSRDEHVLSDVHAVTQILNALEAAVCLATQSQPSQRDVAALMTNPLAGIDRNVVDRLETWCRLVVGHELNWQVLQELAADDSSCVEKTEPAEDTGEDELQDDNDVATVPPGLQLLAEPLAAFVRRIQRSASIVASGGTCHEALWALWQGSPWASALRRRALAGDASADRDLDGLCSLFDIAEAGHSMAGVSGGRRFIDMIRREQIPADRARESDEDRDGVTAVTAHRVKGKEFSVVAVCGLEEGNWPADNHTGSLVGADRWSPDGPVPSPGWSENLRAETRLLLVACSRATDQLLLCSVDSPDEGKRPSGVLTGIPHLEEGADVLHVASLTELVGELRRAVADENESPAVRGQAQQLLNDMRGEEYRGRPLVPQADPRNWWCEAAPRQAGVNGEIELGASHIGELLTCPRRWFMTRRAGASSGAALRASIGTLVHRICAENMGRWSLPEALAELEDSWPDIELTAEWQRAAELEDAKTALKRFDGWVMSRHREFLGAEVRVDGTIEVPSGVARVRGSIDRLERDPQGACYVVDLKTGTSTSPETKNSHRLQIGVYQAVVASGGVSSLGKTSVSGAELVHLRMGAGKGQADAKVDHQSGLWDVPWPDEMEPVEGCRNWIEASVDKAIKIVKSGEYTAIANTGCGHCPARAGCPALTPKDPSTAAPRQHRMAS
ncbi:ATP-dependent DNA helicase [Cutibacterium equinum]|uniref:DNA 3'-5' helicase n=1 Tax=Cutibacterium equinum TaxID=3016342 RepID=A0ABY7QX51_9ACTN|nr:ATP-dependent DNA helicase [Cutibacterium equinum]WCC79107.1 ATP-dependent DNA helicase [Cutibacterium equinum]